MKIDGRCHCGFITYEAEIDPANVGICHCTDCQSLTGSAFRTMVHTPEARFRLLSGSPKTYVKTAESGNLRAQVFCPECGSPIYATSVGPGPKVLGIRVGTIRQRATLPPRKQYWTRSALAWLGDIAGLPKVDAQ
jgi:hypothetical protein